MHSTRVLVPGARDVRGTLDTVGEGDAQGDEALTADRPDTATDDAPDATTASDAATDDAPDATTASDAATDDAPTTDAAVVACPPHPQFGGNRRDRRLRAVSDALTERGIDCLRFDYGEWDDGYGEREDARNAVRWARERYDRVGLFGYSFGGAMAILAAADVDVRAVSALAPAAQVAADPDLDVLDALERLPCRTQIVYGSRDETADWEPIVEKARELGHDVVECSADHHFVGQDGKIGDAVSGFFEAELG
jgi:hypothetical protein